MASNIFVGAQVVTGGKKGVVKFIGRTEFSSGDWIGVALVDPCGKNNGSVAGVQYFDCPEGHGLFVKGAQVKLVDNAIKSSDASTSSQGQALGSKWDRIAALRVQRKLRDEAKVKAASLEQQAPPSVSVSGASMDEIEIELLQTGDSSQSASTSAEDVSVLAEKNRELEEALKLSKASLQKVHLEMARMEGEVCHSVFLFGRLYLYSIVITSNT